MVEIKTCPFCGTSGAHKENCYINLYFESEVLGADIPWEVMATAWNIRAECTCEGCVIPSRDYGHAPSPCNFCSRNNEERYDLYTSAKVVEP